MSGIYIHIPFCKQACNYCNFHFSTSLRQKNELVDALIKEIALTGNSLKNKGEEISTVYFGGGTPSILSSDDLKRIFETLDKNFSINGQAEITLEANPDDINTARLSEWKEIGINRFSVGIQSFLEEELKWMNRAHNANDSLKCIDEIKNAGFDNFSIDLIYGSPLLDNDSWKRNVDIIFEKGVPHISCYALTVEPKTALDKLIQQHQKQNIDPEKQAEQFLLLMNWMQQAGFEHYEISNYARPGYRSRHNSSYWQGKPYYGFGPSAHSFNGCSRKWNIANNTLYIQSLQKDIIPFEEEILTDTQKLNEYIMTSLRTIEGLNLDYVHDNFGKDAVATLKSFIVKWENGNKLIKKDAIITLTKEGKLFADGIAADLFF